MPAVSSSGGGGGSAMSSTVTAGSGAGEPWRPTDFRFRVRCRSSRKLGCPPEPFLGDVGGERGGAFFSELLFHDELLTGGTGGGGGGACG